VTNGTALRLHSLHNGAAQRGATTIQRSRDRRVTAAPVEEILESITDAFLALDAEGHLLYVNRQAERLMGSPRDDVIGLSLWELYPHLLSSRGYAEYQRVIRDKVEVEFEEYFPEWNAWLEVRGHPAPYGLTVYYRDVTRRKRSEEIHQALTTLASHDLRNALMLIRGSAQLLIEQLHRGPVDPQRIERQLQRVDRAALRMSAVIDDQIDLMHLERGVDLVPQRSRFDLVALLYRTVDAYQHSTDSHELVVETEADSLEGNWDLGRIERLVGNLLSNAIKYSPEGTKIRVSACRDHTAEGDFAAFSVEDHGMGIPASDLPHIFQRFYRASNVGPIHGSGIGLAGAHHIIELHGGRIDVVSHEGKGTVVTVALPFDPGDSAVG